MRFILVRLATTISQIALLWWANGGPTVRVLMGQRWPPPVAHCGFVQRASVGPPVASHRWASVGPPLGQRYTNDKCAVGPTVAATGGPLWVCPTSLCWPTGGYSHRWASVGPPLGQRWLATGGPLLAHRWLATVGPTVGQRYTNDKCAVGPTMASHR